MSDPIDQINNAIETWLSDDTESTKESLIEILKSTFELEENKKNFIKNIIKDNNKHNILLYIDSVFSNQQEELTGDFYFAIKNDFCSLNSVLEFDPSINKNEIEGLKNTFIIHLYLLSKLNEFIQIHRNIEDKNNSVEQSIKKIDAVLDSLQEQIEKKVKKNSRLKKIAVELCRIMGGVVGLILIPIMPITVMRKYANNRLDNSWDDQDKDYAAAIGHGMMGFVAGAVLSPFYAAHYGYRYAGQFSWIKSHDKSEKLHKNMSDAASARKDPTKERRNHK